MQQPFTIPVIVTRSGAAAMWHEGGFSDGIGRAVVITGAFGERVRPYFIRREHASKHTTKLALMPLYIGSFIIHADSNRDTDTVRILQVRKLAVMNEEFPEATVSLVAERRYGEWDLPPPGVLTDAIAAADELVHNTEPLPNFIVSLRESV